MCATDLSLQPGTRTALGLGATVSLPGEGQRRKVPGMRILPRFQSFKMAAKLELCCWQHEKPFVVRNSFSAQERRDESFICSPLEFGILEAWSVGNNDDFLGSFCGLIVSVNCRRDVKTACCTDDGLPCRKLTFGRWGLVCEPSNCFLTYHTYIRELALEQCPYRLPSVHCLISRASVLYDVLSWFCTHFVSYWPAI